MSFPQRKSSKLPFPIGRLSADLLAYFSLKFDYESDEFDVLNRKGFAELLAKVYHPETCETVLKCSADDVFAHCDIHMNGEIGFAEFFDALVAGPIIKDKCGAQLLVWSAAEFGTGDADVDADHIELFRLIDKIIHAIRVLDVAKIQSAIAGLKEYTCYHFIRQIEMLELVPTEEYDDDSLILHHQAHSKFVKKINDFEQEFENESVAAVCKLVSGDLIDFLAGWLSGHIKGTDMKLSKQFKMARHLMEETDQNLTRLGYDNFTLQLLSSNLLNYFRNTNWTWFSNMNMNHKTFSELLALACPQTFIRDDSDKIFNFMDKRKMGEVGFAGLFRILVAGPLMDAESPRVPTWTAETFGCQHHDIDDDHQELFRLINSIHDAAQRADSSRVLMALRGMKSYTKYHFDREIDLLANCDEYPRRELVAHVQAHDSFIGKINDFEREFGEGGLSAVCDLVSGQFIQYLISWLSGHIQNTDMKRCSKYFSYLKES